MSSKHHIKLTLESIIGFDFKELAGPKTKKVVGGINNAKGVTPEDALKQRMVAFGYKNVSVTFKDGVYTVKAQFATDSKNIESSYYKLSESFSGAIEFRKHITNALVEKVRSALAEKEKQIAKNFFNKSSPLNLLSEDVVETLNGIVKDSSMKPVKFKDGSTMRVDMQTANLLITVHGALKKPEAKAKFEEMLNSSKSTFMKAVDFSWKMVK